MRARLVLSVVVAVAMLSGCQEAEPGSASGAGTTSVAETSLPTVAASSVTAEAPAVVSAGSRTTIEVSITGDQDSHGSVDVKLDGPGAVNVTRVAPTPGKLVFTAAAEPDVTATITLSAASPAGTKPRTLVIKTVAAKVSGAYRIYGVNGENRDVKLDGIACDLSKPFSLTFSDALTGTMKFAPADSRSGQMTYSATLNNAPMTTEGHGPYTIELNPSGSEGTLTYTQSGVIHGGGSSTNTWELRVVSVPACAT